jgi:type IV secretory pathway TraG/TraD family ATPase VirD4
MSFDALLTVWVSIPPLSRPFLVLVPISLVMLVFLNRTPSARAEGPRPRAARWATRRDLRPLLANRPPARGILLGRADRSWVAVQPTALRRELAHALVVGPPRSGKGLLAVTQLLTWEGSCIVNDLKGELFDLTAGYRSKFSHIVVIDPRGLGQQFDPLAGRTSEDECLAAAVAMLDASHAGKDASDFVMRAAAMLAAIFRAAAIEGVPALLYARQAVRRDLVAVAERLQDLDPALAVQFLAAAQTRRAGKRIASCGPAGALWSRG